MGQKTNPIGNRLGIIRGWESNWYGSKKDYAQKLIEDSRIRGYLNARINKGGIAKIVIERTLNKLIITIHTSKPGIIIGKGGGEVDRIKEELKKLTGKEDVQINILEIRRPELDAQIVGETIAKQIENRINRGLAAFSPSPLKLPPPLSPLGPPKPKPKVPSPPKPKKSNLGLLLSPSSKRVKIRAPNSGRVVYANGAVISLQYLKNSAARYGVDIKGLRSKADIARKLFNSL